MKHLVLVATAATLMVGCASQQPAPAPQIVYQQPMQQAKVDITHPVDGVYKLQGYKGPEAMENIEVIEASKECIQNRLRPNVSYLMVKTDQGKVRVPVSVSCEPF